MEEIAKPVKITKKALREKAVFDRKQDRIYKFIAAKMQILVNRGLTESEAEMVASRMAREKFL